METLKQALDKAEEENAALARGELVEGGAAKAEG